MSASAGWYDDPRDPLLLRYWDGVMWTDHTTPKQSPTAAQSHIGEAHAVPAAQGRSGQQGSATQSGYPPFQGQGQAPGTQQGYGGQQGYGQQGYGAQGQPGCGGYGSAPQWQQPRSLGLVTTPDGVETSGWWKRVLARFLDGIFTGLIALPFTVWFYVQYVRVTLRWVSSISADAQAGRATSTFTLPAQVYTYLIPIALITFAVATIYEVLLVSRTGATWGKRIVGISVRLRDVPGPPPASAVLKRYAVWQGAALLGLIPFIGSILSLFQLLDGLWPLWDQRRQALHDKVAATNVVVGPQPRRVKAGAVAGSGGQQGPSDQGGPGLG